MCTVVAVAARLLVFGIVSHIVGATPSWRWIYANIGNDTVNIVDSMVSILIFFVFSGQQAKAQSKENFSLTYAIGMKTCATDRQNQCTMQGETITTKCIHFEVLKGN